MIEGGGPAIQMPMPQNMLESEMIGAIKIKDGLFIGDELASTVSRQRSHAFIHRDFSCRMKRVSLLYKKLSILYSTAAQTVKH